MMAFIVVFLLALGAGALGGLVGTGSSLVLLPVLVTIYGPRMAVPMMGIAAVMANIARVAAWWRQIRWRPVLAYALPGTPAAVLGAHTLLTISPKIIDGLLGVFFLAMIPVRRVMTARAWRVRLWQLGVAGAVVGFLTGLVLSTGPLSVPVFTGFGLSGGAFLGTEAASSLVLYAGKLATFGQFGALTLPVFARGLAIGTADGRPLPDPRSRAPSTRTHLRRLDRRGSTGCRRRHVHHHLQPMSAVRALASSSDVCLRAASIAVNVNMCRTPRHRVRRRRRGQQASRSPSWSTRRRAPTCPTSTPPETECTPTTDVSAARPAARAHRGVSPSPTPHRLSVAGRPPGPVAPSAVLRRQLT
jgi:uncharacterized protein